MKAADVIAAAQLEAASEAGRGRVPRIAICVKRT